MPSFDPSNVDVVDMLECLDIRNISKPTASEFRFSCPFPNHDNGDENASAYMNEDTSAFFCHGCKEKGNAVHFASRVLEISQLETIRLLKERYQPGYLNPDAVSMKEEVTKIWTPDPEAPSQPILPGTAYLEYDVEWEDAHKAWVAGEGFPATDYMFERGFNPFILSHWSFGYDQLSDRITLPICDLAGNLIGFKARAYDDRHPKYLVLGDKPNRPPRYGFPCYFPSRVVFGASRVHPGEEDLIVCEGEFNVVSIDQKICHPAVAINGSHFTEAHARIIRKIARSVVLFLDSDQAGDEATALIASHLTPYMTVKIVPPHEGDPASMSSEEIRNLLGQAESSLVRLVTTC